MSFGCVAGATLLPRVGGARRPVGLRRRALTPTAGLFGPSEEELKLRLHAEELEAQSARAQSERS
jgi:hypothetical protein